MDVNLETLARVGIEGVLLLLLMMFTRQYSELSKAIIDRQNALIDRLIATITDSKNSPD
jgi:hypothetical protein